MERRKMSASSLPQYQLRLAISDERLRAALHACRDAVLAPTPGELLCMERKALQGIAEALVATVLEDEIDWIEEHSISCTIKLTDDEHVYILDFERLAEALLFQRIWGGEFRERRGRLTVH
jgi:hypothetical protein